MSCPIYFVSNDMSEVKKFTIGEFTFDTFHEYRDAQEDLKKIECINEELDIHDPKVAVRLYNLMRAGKIEFKTPIGTQFADHISDILAENNIDLLEDQAFIDEAESKVKYQKYLGFAAIGLAIVLFGYFAVNQANDALTARQLSKLAKTTQTEGAATVGSSGSSDAEYSVTTGNPFEWSENIKRSSLTVLPEYQSLVEANADTVGWLAISDTEINYPVVQSSDNEYYLKRSFYGEDDSNGTLFVDYRSDIVNQNTNTIIYGHNMRSGMMFGGLKNYLDKSFYENHKTITFNTIYEHRTYEVVAVGLSEVEYQDTNAYRYYNFIQASNRAEWQAFIDNVKSLSVYDFDTSSIKETDKFLTLSTCNDYTEDGRLFIVAKRVE